MLRALRLTVVLSVPLVVAACASAAGRPGPYEIPALTSFRLYPIDGGPPPGSIVRIDRRGRVQGEVISRDRALQYAADRAVLDVVDGNATPAQTVDATSYFNAELSAGASRLGVSGEAAARATKRVQLELAAGRVRTLRSGEVGAVDLLRSLPEAELELVLRQMRDRGGAWMISAVDERPSARLRIEWRRGLSLAARDTVLRAVGVQGSVQNSDSLTADVTITSATRLGYRALQLSKREVEAELQKRREGRRSVAYFPDADGDGFGAAGAQPTLAERPIAGMVANRLDCFDGNAAARPGQTDWFERDRGDGSFDYNCDGQETPRWQELGRCNSRHTEAVPPGWLGNVPRPGVLGTWLEDCDDNGPFRPDVQETSQRRQQGR